MARKTSPFFKELMKAESVKVKVGIFKKDEGFSREDAGGINLATVAYYNEYGYGVPERRALRQALETGFESYSNIISEELKKAIEKDTFSFLGHSLGARVSSDFKESIKSWSTPPNAPSTIRKKGFNNPLVEYGDYYKRIGYNVNDSKTYKLGDDS